MGIQRAIWGSEHSKPKSGTSSSKSKPNHNVPSSVQGAPVSKEEAADAGWNMGFDFDVGLWGGDEKKDVLQLNPTLKTLKFQRHRNLIKSALF